MMNVDPYWIEGPVIDSLSNLHQGEWSAVWKKRYQYTDSPNLVAIISEINTVVKFKISNFLWQDRYDLKDLKNNTNWYKYLQAAMTAPTVPAPKEWRQRKFS